MTLNTRNRLLTAFTILTALAIAALGIAAVVFAAAHTFLPVPDFPRAYPLPDFIPFSGKSTAAAICSIALLLVYIPVMGLLTLRSFEKTQSPEVIYFSLFLIGVLLQCVRICVPFFHLWQGYSDFLVFSGRAYFAGQLLCVTSFLFSALFSSEKQLQNADKNLYILSTIAIIFASLIPIKPDVITSAFLPQFGFSEPYMIIIQIILVLTFAILLLTGKTKQGYRYEQISSGFLLLIIGYGLLSCADSYAHGVIGGILLFSGTYLYLSSIHKYYLWK